MNKRKKLLKSAQKAARPIYKALSTTVLPHLLEDPSKSVYNFVSTKIYDKYYGEISLDHSSFPFVQKWILDKVVGSKIVFSSNEDLESTRSNGIIEATGPGTYSIVIAGCKCRISIYRKQSKFKNDPDFFSCKIILKKTDVEKVKKEIQEQIIKGKQNLHLGLPVYSNVSSYWELSIIREKRKKETLHYDGLNPIDEILSSIENWQQGPKVVGANNNYGILLTGKPGTGKTTLGIVVASELNRSLYVSGANLGFYLIRTVPYGSVILIDECDSVLYKRTEEKTITENKKVGDLLSALDGPFTPSNCIFIYTTNTSVDNLDPAFVRPGRVDLVIDMNQYRTPTETTYMQGNND